MDEYKIRNILKGTLRGVRCKLKHFLAEVNALKQELNIFHIKLYRK